MVRIQQKVSGVEKGSSFGAWKVLGVPFSIGVSHFYVVAQCECGRVSVVRCSSLGSGGTNQCYSCGPRQGATKHGDAVDGRVCRLYGIRSSMLKRCYGTYHKYYRNYGGRGISVCQEWRDSYEAFRDWALANGYEDGLTLDRRDNSGNYEPGNCRWVTYRENSRNTRVNRIVKAFGVEKCVADWADDVRCAVKGATLLSRLNNGWPPEEAISIPTKQKRKLCV